MYLNKEEYASYHYDDVPNDKFERLSDKASDVLNNITRFYYVDNDFDSDNGWRKEQFKKAVACQINYFNATGHTTSEELNSEPQTQTIGRTSISNGNSSIASNHSTKDLLCSDVYIYLEGTGLLNRGVN